MTSETVLAAVPSKVLRRTITGEVRRQWRLVGVVLVTTVVASGAIAVGPWLVREGIDKGVVAGDRAALGLAVAGYLVALLVGGLANGARTTAMAVAAERFLDGLRVRALGGILRLDIGVFDRGRRGDLLARVTADTEALSSAARSVLPELVRLVSELAASVVAVALLEPLLALLALVAVPPMVGAGAVLRRRGGVVYPRYREEIGALAGLLTETVEGAGTVRTYGRQAERVDRLRAANRLVAARYLDGTAMRNRFYATITITRVTTTALVVVAAGLLAIDGRITVGTAAAGVLAVTAVFRPLAWLTELLDDAMSALAALERVVQAASVPSGDREPESQGSLPRRGDLVFDRVSFAYVAGRPVLQDIDLVIPAGTRVAVVGETGAGKSTLARLAAGLSSPAAGVVRFGGVDLAATTAAQRRERLIFVSQEPYLVSGSLADNLLLVAPDATDDELSVAAERTGLTAWLASRPGGLHGDTGVNGSLLSQGERQLVSVLRVAVADPAIVILDEATAALDPITEALVGAALDGALAGRTLLVIAHRPETAARCSQVVRLINGHARTESVGTTSSR